jgi:hypothetical protein
VDCPFFVLRGGGGVTPVQKNVTTFLALEIVPCRCPRRRGEGGGGGGGGGDFNFYKIIEDFF